MILKKIIKKVNSIFKSQVLFPYNKEFIKLFSSFNQCFILGSSPTINKLDLTKLKEDSMKISMGNFYEHPDIEIIKPNIHIFAASHKPITEKVLTDWWGRCNEILPKNTSLLIEKRDRNVAEKVFVNREIFYYSYGGNFPIDFTKKIISPRSVTIVALQLAIYSKVKEINLLGINHDWQCVKPYGHFFDHSKPCLEYYLKKENITINYEVQKQPFPKERLYKEYELYQQYETLLLKAEKNNAKIYNSDKYSDFDVFPFKNTFSN